MKPYNPSVIEPKWQKIWDEEHRFEVPNHAEGKENRYVLIEFPYPSGKGLHTGHVRSYSAMDAVARKLRLQGYNVLFPMGCDAFGLEAERTAIREHKFPQEIVARNIATFKKQLKSLGLSVDWSREVNTSDPSYYKWTQWLFLQFVKHGLAEKREMMVNYCPNCGVLANEEVEDGKCCQCGSQTTQKDKSQWVLKITKYGERLADDLQYTKYMQHIKTSQINWIGKSEGVEVDFDTTVGVKFSIFTTCIETIFGITFMVVAPDGKIVDKLKPYIKNWAEVEAYRKETAKKSEFVRKELNKEKTGVILEGVQAINPVNGKKVPIYAGDFVLASYGTGAVMAVPTHDQRDYEFADKYGIDKIVVISGGDTSAKAFEKADYLGKGCKLVNSGEFNGLTVEEAKVAITNMLAAKGVARKTLNFRMTDWVFSRQRYWGEPIPMIYCEHCGWQPVPEDQLPLLLPKVESYEANKEGESPLAAITDWVNTTCPKCGGPAKRETDTMPGWAGSSWYFMRYCDPHNDKEFASLDALKAWLPVNLYNGGNEHTARHLLYARFWNKFFYDIGISPVLEPFERRVSQGIVLGSNGVKMSKSLGNVVDPLEVIADYGADALRVWEAFMGDYFETVNWSDDGTKACYKLLNRIWNMQEIISTDTAKTSKLNYAINHAIKKVSADIDNIKFNTAISEIMTCVNEIYKVGAISAEQYKTLITLISPFAPHIAEELFEVCNFGAIKDATWPVADESALVLDTIEVPVQVNGKIRGVVVVSTSATQDEVIAQAKANADVARYLGGVQIKKIIYVPKKILNIII
jgi:leucyl-tRNA synthetase